MQGERVEAIGASQGGREAAALATASAYIIGIRPPWPGIRIE